MSDCTRSVWRLWCDNISRMLAVVTLLVCAAFAQAQEQAWLVREGKPQAVIVVPAKDNPVALFAAQELQHHLKLITDATLPVLKENDAAVKEAKVRLYIGLTSRTIRDVLDPRTLPPSGYVLRTVGTSLYFAGQDEVVRFKGESGQPVASSLDRNSTRIGSMLAVYDYLENELGVRWLWPGDLGTHYTRQTDLPLPDLNRQSQPRYEYKSWRVPKFMRESPGWSSDTARDSFLHAQTTWLRRHRYQQVIPTINAGTHSFGHYWREYGKTNPEYFALLPNGKREPLSGDLTGSRTTMCVSQPALWTRIIENWAQADRTPLNQWLSLGENDSPGICTCENCRAWDAPDPGFQNADYWGKGIIPTNARRFRWDWTKSPSLSDRYARFYLSVYDQARKTHPDIIVAGFAYANYVNPPKHTQLHDRIVISLVPGTTTGTSSSTYFPFTATKQREFYEQWDGWRATGARMGLRPNFTLSGHNMPIYYADTFGKAVQYAAENGMIGSDFDSLRGSFATQGPSYYVVARVMEKPELGVDGALAEYYAAFGPAADAVRAYFEHWRDVSDRITQERMLNAIREAGAFRTYSQWFLMAPMLFSEADMARGRELLNQARQIRSDDPLVARRLEYLRLGLQDSEQVLKLTRIYQDYQRKPNEEKGRNYAKAMADLQQMRLNTEGWHLANHGVLAREERQIFDWNMIQTLSQDSSTRLPLIWQFQWDAENVGQSQGWYKPDFNDAGWDSISYGAWQQQPPGVAWFGRNGQHYHGYAWYRTPMKAPTFTPGKDKVLLQFGAVDETARVWIDGKQVLDRVFDRNVNANAWQEPFEIDVTDLVKPGQTHQLTVRVQSLGGQGGITRPVHLNIESR